MPNRMPNWSYGFNGDDFDVEEEPIVPVIVRNVSRWTTRISLMDVISKSTESVMSMNSSYSLYYQRFIYQDTVILDLYVFNENFGSFCIDIKRKGLKQTPSHFEYHNVMEYSTNYVNTYIIPISTCSEENYMSLTFEVSRPMNDALPKSLTQSTLLRHGLGELMGDIASSDFVIHTSDSKTFSAHKMILSAQSDVFQAMVQHNDLEEGQSGVVTIPDFFAEDIRAMLEFMYTGSIQQIHKKDCCQLIRLADKYNVCGMKILAENALTQMCNVENALIHLKVGEMHDCQLLKKRAALVIQKNKREIIASDEWSLLNDINVVRMVFDIFLQ